MCIWKQIHNTLRVHCNPYLYKQVFVSKGYLAKGEFTLVNLLFNSVFLRILQLDFDNSMFSNRLRLFILRDGREHRYLPSKFNR